MASKFLFDFYLILHSILFIVTVFVVQVYCDSAISYHVQNADEPNSDPIIIPLVREKRQLLSSEKKPEEPVEDKSKITKKPTAVDTKLATSLSTESHPDKPRLGVSKKELQTGKTNDEAVHAPEKEHLDNDESHVTHSIQGPVNTTASPPKVAQTLKSTTVSSTMSQVSTVKVSTEPALTNISIQDHDIQISKMFDANIEKTLNEHNITKKKEDYHQYYNSSFVVDPEVGHRYWVDFNKYSDVKVSEILSQAYRRAMTVKLSFDFPFYGHLIRNITIATGGFLYTGEYVHSWLAATQYIAPLMANFDTSLSNNSFVKYLDNGTSFTVQWENVILQDKKDQEGFTFQCTLYKNGDIVFVYQHVPVVIDQIDDDQHPVKIGLSDAYIIDRTIFFVRRKTIYEYHRVHFQKQDIKDWTVIVLNALDTCLDMKDCHSCLTQLQNLRCNWCANRCSNGKDRHRQDWMTNGCDETKLKSVEECSKEEPDHGEESVIGVAGIMGILFLVCLGLGIGMWFFYAFRNPHTPAGQFLIKYRPSQWSWRRGEARYTAATIHM